MIVESKSFLIKNDHFQLQYEAVSLGFYQYDLSCNKTSVLITPTLEGVEKYQTLGSLLRTYGTLNDAYNFEALNLRTGIRSLLLIKIYFQFSAKLLRKNFFFQENSFSYNKTFTFHHEIKQKQKIRKILTAHLALLTTESKVLLGGGMSCALIIGG